MLISSVTDIYKGDIIYRKSGSKEIEILDDKVIKITENIYFNSLPKYLVKDQSFIPNINTGVIDTETYLNNDGFNRIYALGFRTNLREKPIIYYIDEVEMSSENIVVEMINELLRPKYKGITFYCHNLGGFDSVFILSTLYNYNDNNENKFNISCILRDDKIIKISIKKDENILIILDSYAMLPSSLSKLGKDFNVDTIKSIFPYKFATENHLFYTGHTPGIQFYDDLSIEDYTNLYKENWSFKDETLKYLKNDLNSLYEILIKVNKQVFLDYNINIKEAITI